MMRIPAMVICCGLLFFGATPPVSAEEGFYIGLGFPYNTIWGGFDGNSTVAESGNVIYVPKIDGALGWGILLGYGVNPEASFELSYLASNHNAKWTGARGDVDYTVLNFDLKYGFNTSRPTQPYILFGINIDTLVVKNGSFSAVLSKAGDATYTGTGLNLGLGMDHYFNPKVSTGVGLTYRIVEYDHAKGISNSGQLKNFLNGNGFGLILDGAYHF
ncbi:MAG: porin family protein [Nitrospirae bacterium]|nr:porin family protein [Nitrospirota bacterium]